MHVHDGQVGSPPLLHILICVQPHQQEVTQFPCFLQQGSIELVSGALWLRAPRRREYWRPSHACQQVPYSPVSRALLPATSAGLPKLLRVLQHQSFIRQAS